MEKIKLADVSQYVETHIGTFHQRRIVGLQTLQLKTVLKKKNPYLFRAKHLLTAEQIVKELADAFISSKEETIFGDWLEGLAIFINEKVFQGRKSAVQGIDLEFGSEGIRYIVAIKSGPNWGNSSQIAKMRSDFKTAMKTLRTSNTKLQIVAVNGCCYGRDNFPDKGDYFKYCGQRFWEFISGERNLFVEIVDPLGHKAKEKNEEFVVAYSQMINKFTNEFFTSFCKGDGAIDWDSLVKFNSGDNQRMVH